MRAVDELKRMETTGHPLLVTPYDCLHYTFVHYICIKVFLSTSAPLKRLNSLPWVYHLWEGVFSPPKFCRSRIALMTPLRTPTRTLTYQNAGEGFKVPHASLRKCMRPRCSAGPLFRSATRPPPTPCFLRIWNLPGSSAVLPLSGARNRICPPFFVITHFHRAAVEYFTVLTYLCGVRVLHYASFPFSLCWETLHLITRA